MWRAEDLQDKLDQWMKLLYANLPDDIAVYVNVYIRDKANNPENRKPWQEDGEVSIRVLNKNCTMYDRAMALQDMAEQKSN